MPLDQSVEKLLGQDEAVTGLLSILDELNIGVYQSDGTPVLLGSEDGPDDLWLLAELLPGLAQSASLPGPTFAEFTESLPGVIDSGITPTELAAAYQNMIETFPEFPMSRLLTALGLDLTGQGTLSRFEAWLLLVALAPSNESITVADPALLVAAGPEVVAADVPCDNIKGDESFSGSSLAEGYGNAASGAVEGALNDQLGTMVEGAATTSAVATISKVLKTLADGLGKLNKLIDIAKAAQIIANTDISVEAFDEYAHKVHDSQGETPETNRVRITVDVKFGGVTAATEFHCKFAGLLGLPPAGTPVGGAQVSITLDQVLAEHGSFRWEDSNAPNRISTDPNGRAVAFYVPKNEKPKAAQELGDAFIRRQEGTFTVNVDAMTAMGQLFNPVAGVELAADILGIKDITRELTVAWHDPAVHLSHVVPMTGFWTGNWALDLQTCDGTNWTGFVVMNAEATVQGTKMSQIGDSPISFTIPAGQTSATAPVEIKTTFSTKVKDATVDNQITQTGTISVDLSSIGTDAKVNLDLSAGSQDILVQVPGFSVPGGGGTESSSQSFTIPMQPANCGD